MINDDILIKVIREDKNYKFDWPERVRNLKKRLQECLMGFPGIGFKDLTFTSQPTESDEYIIIDRHLWDFERYTDYAPMLIHMIPDARYWIIEGIGCQEDLREDPTRTLKKWKDPVRALDIMRDFPDQFSPRLKVTGKPVKSKGQPGSIYHYFFRCLRDQRP